MIPSLRQDELEIVVKQCQILKLAKLQDVLSSENEFAFLLYQQGNLYWFYFLLQAANPLFMVFENQKPPLTKKMKPLAIFCKANCIGLPLLKIELDSTYSRILHFDFGSAKLEARLFPHGQNLIVEARNKKISWNKPKELKASSVPKSFDKPPRSMHEIRAEYLKQKQEFRQKQKNQEQKNFDKAVLKKEKAIEKIRQDIQEKENQDWFGFARELEAKQSLNISSEWQSYVLKEESFIENLGRAYDKAKQKQSKIEKAKERLRTLSTELDELKTKAKLEPKAYSQPDLIGQSGAKARAKSLKNGLKAFVGRSAKDNLSLLRKAKPWHLWMHLRDRPGSHMIIAREKKQEVDNASLEEFAQFLIQASGFSRSLQKGESFEVQVSECRYIRPIRGDKLGRVQVSQEEVYQFRKT